MKVIVIGGGAAGMMAAAQAALHGADVLLIEQNEKLGKKLYITGKGRCNLTNDCSDEEFLSNVVKNSKFLYSAINAFSSRDVQAFVEDNGTKLKVERGNRVFPVSDKSSDVIKAFVNALESLNVKIMLNTSVTELVIQNGTVRGVKCGKTVLDANSVVLATGGCSYAQTGSDGKAFQMVKTAGHSVTALNPALVPINTKNVFSQLQGLSLKNVKLCAKKGKKELFAQQGEMLFTHFGISGPLVLTMSSMLPTDDLSSLDIYVDLKPALTKEQLENRIIKDMLACGAKRFKNSLGGLAPSNLQPVLVELSRIDGEKRADQLTRAERERLVELFKHFPLEAVSRRGFNEAIITRGGVEVKQVNSSTMESKLVGGLYFAGEMLDVDALTGGFNLQIAFSTGYLAGKNAAIRVQEDII